MSDVEIKPLGDGGFLLSGALTFDTVPALWRQSTAQFNNADALTLDLQGITHTDSAGLALLIEWMRTARNRNKTIAFRNIPPQMLAIAKVSGVEQILPLL